MARKRKADKQKELKTKQKEKDEEGESSPLHDLWPQIIRYVFASYESSDIDEEEVDDEREDDDDHEDEDKSDAEENEKEEESETNTDESPELMPINQQYQNLSLVCKEWNKILKQDEYVKKVIRGILNDLYDFSNFEEGGVFMDQLNDQCDDSGPVDQIFSESLAKYYTNTESHNPLFISPLHEANVNPNQCEDISNLKELLSIYRSTFELSELIKEHDLQWNSETNRPVVPCVFYYPSRTFSAKQFGEAISIHRKLLAKADYWYEEKQDTSSSFVSDFILKDDEELVPTFTEKLDEAMKGGAHRVQYCYYDKMDLTTKPVFVVNKRGNYIVGLFSIAVET